VRRPVFLIPFLFFFTAQSLAQPVVSFKGNDERKIQHNEIAYLAENDSVRSVDLARACYDRGQFTINTQPDLNLGIAKDNYWVAFQLQANIVKAEKYFINLANPRLNEVEIFLLRNDTLLPVTRLGDNFPFGNRPIYTNDFTFPVQLLPQETITVFLHIKHKGNTLQVPIRVVNLNGLLNSVERDYLFTGTISGIFLITFFFGIFFLFNTKDVLFLYYSGYILAACTWMWTTEGFAFQYLWPNSPDLATRLGPGISAVSACFFMANCMQFSKPYDSTSRYRKIIFVVFYLLIAWTTTPFIPIMPITENTMSIYLSVYFTANIIIAALLFVYLIKLSTKNQVILYYLAAVVVTIASSVVVVLRGAGMINSPFSTSTIMSTGYVLELILMTFGITRQFYIYREEKEFALLENINQQKSINEKIINTQRTERERIGRELHDDIGPRLTHITLMSEAANRQLPAASKSAHELKEIAAASRNIVSSMSEIVWSLSPESRSLKNLLAYLREQLNKVLEYTSIDYQIHFEEGETDREMEHIQLRTILLVTKEIVNNAVKYSDAKKLTISCTIHSTHLYFEITDDGVGIDLTAKISGHGLKNIRKRIEEINGEITIESAKQQGVRIRYSIPY
jgi:signal transduction histidine kinase